ncbi:hypothetical protein [Plebeiibacterium marinum]|uniref:Uncharacterized protein n=1 Tax=Plebeiibacterium marinum TaxID=2992111 RepID=A0AAE3MGM1_9BACT|nr:hypothetical protein [Plebeiobacterium marinum]MCW3807478.1 hypothetical protein [Plebeiobacterium marinum]
MKEKDQIKLLVSLAKKIKSEVKDREKVITSLQEAHILTKNENFTTQYTNLKKVVITK